MKVFSLIKSICYTFIIMDKDFYKRALRIAVPIMIQNGITNFVAMLDNIMIGQIGTNQMSSVAIVNQLMFVFNLCIFGGLSGIGIFTAQFYGKKDDKGIRHCFRLMFMLACLLSFTGIIVFLTNGSRLISLYLSKGDALTSAEDTLFYAKQYLQIMLIGMLPFALTQVYSSTLRSTNETIIPMRGSMLAVFVNLIGNYILIYGKLGFPVLGVRGAAIATALSRFVELAFVAIWTHRHKEKNAFIQDVFTGFAVPKDLVINCIKKGSPLLFNEFLWSASMATLSQIYSNRGLSVIAAYNISSTIANIFNIAFIALGSATGILIGHELGAGHFKTVKRDANRITVFTLIICILFGIGLFAISGIFPQVYNTSDEIRSIASGFIKVAACCLPMYAYANASYFILRSGGKTMITFLFDSCFSWIVSIPLAYLLVHHTALPIVRLFLFVQLADLIKCGIGFILIENGVWIHDITNTEKNDA